VLTFTLINTTNIESRSGTLPYVIRTSMGVMPADIARFISLHVSNNLARNSDYNYTFPLRESFRERR